VDGPQFQTIRDVFTALEMGKLSVEAAWTEGQGGSGR
jgi:hypothetical protein